MFDFYSMILNRFPFARNEINALQLLNFTLECAWTTITQPKKIENTNKKKWCAN